MKRIIASAITLLFASGLFAQDNTWIYATTTVENAQKIQATHPDGIQILHSDGQHAAVYFSLEARAEIRNFTKNHGPGYIFKQNKDTAINDLAKEVTFHPNVLDFTITQDAYVLQCVNDVNIENIGNTILELEAYGTRFHNQPSGLQAALDIKANWENMINEANRSDIDISFYNHINTPQKSIIVNIPGSDFPDEIVVIGGHLDSGDQWEPYDAPGADDNASGMATLTETLRVLLANDFRPKRTVQIMGYAAEEIGLVGSAEIAQHYKANNKNVLAVAQFDMTNYKGTSYDIAFVNDPMYVSSDLNLYFIELLEHYNNNGAHTLTYGTSLCQYGCSDHVSWTQNGYHASFPFEAAMEETNPYIHSPLDTFATMNNDASHSAKFVKLALEFVIEIAKTNNLSTQEIHASDWSIGVHNQQLIYDLKQGNRALKSLDVFDTSARKVINKNILPSKGEISLAQLKSGVYIAVFKDEQGKAYSKKFLIR